MSKYILKAEDLGIAGFLVLVIIAMMGLAVMNPLNEGHREAVPLTRVENGGVLDLGTLPENLELPNGVVLMGVSIGVAEAHFITRRVPVYHKDGAISYRTILVETFVGDPDADRVNHGNQEMISGKVAVVPEDQSQDLKVTWLDGQHQEVGHTYARIGATTEISSIVFWAWSGSESMKIELA